MDNNAGIVLLAEDGVVSKWTRTVSPSFNYRCPVTQVLQGQNHWEWAKILDAGNGDRAEDDRMCFAYVHNRIAVAFPRSGVKIWMLIEGRNHGLFRCKTNPYLGVWQPQRSILRQNVSSVKFIKDGRTLLGGTSDGVL
jgi:hypothetical protein